jgi:hypothetical protein
MAISLAQASSMDLSQDYNFTGTVTGMGTAGAMTLIKTLTASSSSSLSFVNGSSDVVLDSTYKSYKFVFKNIHGSSTAQFRFNASTDSGSNYNVAKTTTYFVARHDENGSNGKIEYDSGNDLAQGTGEQLLSDNYGADNDASLSGTLWLFNPSSTTYVKHFYSDCQYYQSAVPRTNRTFMSGYGNTTSAINAIRFQMSSGNIDDGTISLYGIS